MKQKKHTLTVLATMDVALRDMALMLARLRTGEREMSLESHRLTGACLWNAALHWQRFDDGDLSMIAEFLSCSPTELDDDRRIALAYRYEEIDALSRRRMSDGRAITYRHLAILAKVTDSDRRTSLLERTFSEAWNPTRLLQETQTRVRSKRPTSGQRPRPALFTALN